MPETLVTIPEGEMTLEGLHQPGKGLEAAVICHPHPLYGGDMGNNVVSILQEVLEEWGWGTLRFNFRGVGGSGGRHDGGRGEVDDLLAAVDYLERQGVTAVHLAAYSFGVWIGLKALPQGLQPASAILVSPPLDFLDFAGLRLPAAPCLVAAGDRDGFCAAGSLERWLAAQAPGKERVDVQILRGCDHFYWNQGDLLAVRIREFLQLRLPPQPAG